MPTMWGVEQGYKGRAALFRSATHGRVASRPVVAIHPPALAWGGLLRGFRVQVCWLGFHTLHDHAQGPRYTLPIGTAIRLCSGWLLRRAFLNQTLRCRLRSRA